MKKIIFALTLTFLIFNFTCYISLSAQDTWVKTYQPFKDLYPYPDCLDYYTEDIVVCQDSSYAINGFYTYSDGWMFDMWGFLIKTDKNGNLLWAKRDTLDFFDHTHSLAFSETLNNKFISTGWNNLNTTYLMKRDSEGNREWVQIYDFAANSMEKTDDNCIILGGNLNGFALRKIDSNGNEIWTKSYEMGAYYSVCNSIIQTLDGGYALTGDIHYSERNNNTDIIVMKTDTEGDSLWTRTFDGYGITDRGFCIEENNLGDLFVSGYFNVNNKTSYGVLIKIDQNGNLIFLKNENNSVYTYLFRSMKTTNENSIVGYGYINSSPALNAYNFNGEHKWDTILPIEVTGFGDKSLNKIDTNFVLCGGFNDNSDITIVRTDSLGQISIDDPAIPEFANIKLFNYPNPFDISTTFYFELPKNIHEPNLYIYNPKGQLVKRVDLKRNVGSYIWKGENYKNIPVSSGLYLYQIRSDKTISKTRKLLILN